MSLVIRTAKLALLILCAAFPLALPTARADAAIERWYSLL